MQPDYQPDPAARPADLAGDPTATPAAQTPAAEPPAGAAASDASAAETSAPASAAPAGPAATEPTPTTPSLPKVGSFVSFDTIDPLTSEPIDGVGVVIDAYTQGEGDDQISRVLVNRLTVDLNLALDDVEQINT